MQTREQKYAESAYNQVHAIWAEGEKYHKQYGSLAHKLPILVRQAGLSQALAFAATRKPDAQQKLLKHLAATVIDDSFEELLNQSRQKPLLEYMRLSENVMLALTWYKRFVQSILGVDPTVEDEEGESNEPT
ncbi:MAG: type III-B CRISPR module-associated protein Cmr5 [Caldilineaceae bacterium]